VNSTGVVAADPGSRLAALRRRREAATSDTSDQFPAYPKVVGFIAGWYATPLMLYLVWLVIVAGDREAVAGRALVDGIPWILGASLVSAGLAAVLRRVTVGWGAIGVSFAAAVIGAGLATITHSFA
jgi:hypothetical protein